MNSLIPVLLGVFKRFKRYFGFFLFSLLYFVSNKSKSPTRSVHAVKVMTFDGDFILGFTYMYDLILSRAQLSHYSSHAIDILSFSSKLMHPLQQKVVTIQLAKLQRLIYFKIIVVVLIQ